MQRRQVLTSMVGIGTAGLAGCLEVFDSCPDPEIESELSFDVNQLDGRLIDEPPVTMVGLAISAEDVDQFDGATTDEQAWVRDTDFDQSVVVGVQLVAGSDASSPVILGVGQENGADIRVYTCIEYGGQQADAVPHSYLLRVNHSGELPDVAHLSNWMDDEWRSYSSQ